MGTTSVELQIFVSLVVVLGAAFVALVCDYLKGSNEQLREKNAVLRVRQEARERRRAREVARLTASPSGAAAVPSAAGAALEPFKLRGDNPVRWQTAYGAAGAGTSTATAVATAPAAFDEQMAAVAFEERPLPVAAHRPHIEATPASPRALRRAQDAALKSQGSRRQGRARSPELERDLMEIAAIAQRKALSANRNTETKMPAAVSAETTAPAPAAMINPAALTAVPEPTPGLDASAGRDILTEAIEVTERLSGNVFAATVAASKPKPETSPAESVETQEPRREVVLVMRKAGDPILAAETGIQITAAAEASSTVSAVPVVEDKAVPAPRSDEEFDAALRKMSATVTTMPRIDLAPNVYDAEALEPYLAAGSSFRGLVMAIGINNYKQTAANKNYRDADLLSLIRSLLDGKHLAFRRQEDEFVLLCRGLNGSDAQKKSREVAEVLWDFQLRHLASFSIAFSWGASECLDQPVAQAIVNSAEEMQDTRRNRQHSGRTRKLGKVANL